MEPVGALAVAFYQQLKERNAVSLTTRARFSTNERPCSFFLQNNCGKQDYLPWYTWAERHGGAHHEAWYGIHGECGHRSHHEAEELPAGDAGRRLQGEAGWYWKSYIRTIFFIKNR